MQILNDFSTSVEKALEEIDPHYRDYPGYVICGTHSPHDVEDMIATITKCRRTGTPFLGICFGHQLAAIEYARNVLGMENAESEELIDPNSPYGRNSYFVVKKLPQLNVGLKFPKETEPNYHEFKIPTPESYWNNFEVVDGFDALWNKEKNFITCQYHPEYQSSKDKPHPLLVAFLHYAKLAM